ncbi:MAG: phage Gp37/Gp68 family protein [bacterium]|nr:phage Gp37/Gp68 family protein [bacterium]
MKLCSRALHSQNQAPQLNRGLHERMVKPRLHGTTMAETTEIAWTDSTFNPWWGCTKVGPGCDHCYAEALDKRTGGSHWGRDAAPRILSADNWRKPKRWQRQAERDSTPRKVFCGSMCDWADKNAPTDQRDRLWGLIRETPMLRWQLLTKRAPNIHRYLPGDWDDGYDHVWLGVTVEDRRHGIRRLDVLREIPAKIRFLSVEPLIEDLGDLDLTGIHWVIVGGESGHHARQMKYEWAMNVWRQCDRQRVPFFFKQWGGRKNKGDCVIGGTEIKQWPCLGV